jgi:ABC-type nitrate/sulfonate/bicarbonate transport system ATPase subunit
VLSSKPTKVRSIIEIDTARPRNLEEAKLQAMQSQLRRLIGEAAPA